MSIQKSSLTLDTALQGIPKEFRKRIVDLYLEIKRRYTKASYNEEWDSFGLSVGKFCETVLRCLQEELTGKHTPFGEQIVNFPGKCRDIIELPKSSGIESLRVIIPRSLSFLYTLRGKRGIGHVGGDVEANKIDSATIVRICDWILCELIRIHHNLSLEEAQAIVDSISTRDIPDIWEVNGQKRILRKDLGYKEKTLLLLYSCTDEGVLIEDLFSWSEHSNLNYFRRDVLVQLHKKKTIEYDKENNIIFISPLGVREVEENILIKKIK